MQKMTQAITQAPTEPAKGAVRTMTQVVETMQNTAP